MSLEELACFVADRRFTAVTPVDPEQAGDDLRCLDEALKAVVGAILQQSNRTAGTIIGVAAFKLVAAGVMAGTFAAIGTFGVAGTGTAIATLSGAAAATATLYWIGSSIGLGVAAGSLMLTGGAIAIGIPAALATRRHILGRHRTEEYLAPPTSMQHSMPPCLWPCPFASQGSTRHQSRRLRCDYSCVRDSPISLHQLDPHPILFCISHFTDAVSGSGYVPASSRCVPRKKPKEFRSSTPNNLDKSVR